MRSRIALAAIVLVACGGEDTKPVHLPVTIDGIAALQYDPTSRTCVHAPEGFLLSGGAYDAARGQLGVSYYVFVYLRNNLTAKGQGDDLVQINAFEVSPVAGGAWSGLPHEPAVRVTAVLRADSRYFVAVPLISPVLASALVGGSPEKPSPVASPGESHQLLVEVRGKGTAADGSPVTTNTIQFPVTIYNDLGLEGACDEGQHLEGCSILSTAQGTFPVQPDGWACVPD